MSAANPKGTKNKSAAIQSQVLSHEHFQIWQKFLAVTDTMHDFYKGVRKAPEFQRLMLTLSGCFQFTKGTDIEDYVMEEMDSLFGMKSSAVLEPRLPLVDLDTYDDNVERAKKFIPIYLGSKKSKLYDDNIQRQLNAFSRDVFDIDKPIFILDANPLNNDDFCLLKACPLKGPIKEEDAKSRLFWGNSVVYDLAPKSADGKIKATTKSRCRCMVEKTDSTYGLKKSRGELFGIQNIKNIKTLSGYTLVVDDFKLDVQKLRQQKKHGKDFLKDVSTSLLKDAVLDTVKEIRSMLGIQYDGKDKAEYIRKLLDLKRAGDYLQVRTAYEWNKRKESDHTMVFVSQDRAAISQARLMGVPCILPKHNRTNGDVWVIMFPGRENRESLNVNRLPTPTTPETKATLKKLSVLTRSAVASAAGGAMALRSNFMPATAAANRMLARAAVPFRDAPRVARAPPMAMDRQDINATIKGLIRERTPQSVRQYRENLDIMSPQQLRTAIRTLSSPWKSADSIWDEPISPEVFENWSIENEEEAEFFEFITGFTRRGEAPTFFDYTVLRFIYLMSTA